MENKTFASFLEGKQDKLWVYECPLCGADAYNGKPGEGLRFRGSAECSKCHKQFSAIRQIPKSKDGPLVGQEKIFGKD